MKTKSIYTILGILILAGSGFGLYYYLKPVNVVTDSPEPTPEDVVMSAKRGDSNLNPDLSVDKDGLSQATVVLTTPKGVIKFKFYPEDAPNHVARLIQLINSGFYDGLTFHRIVPGFVVQGGDPDGNGTGGSGQNIKGEFNRRRHLEGALGMARGPDPDSADSQFYFMLDRHPHLDGKYTVFGQVISGMDVVRSLRQGDKMITVVIE